MHAVDLRAPHSRMGIWVDGPRHACIPVAPSSVDGSVVLWFCDTLETGRDGMI